MTDSLLVNTQSGVCTLTLNRPEQHNAFDDHLVQSLTRALRAINKDKTVRVVVLTGKGETFSSGADINWMQSMVDFDEQTNINDALLLAELMQTLFTLEKPTIAKVNGSAYGGAVGLITCCDFALSSDKAEFIFSEVKLGLVPAVISPYIVLAIGARRANQLFLSAETISIDDALQYGLVDEAVELKFLDATVTAYTDQLISGGPQAQKACKELTRKLATVPEDIRQYTAEFIAKIRTSPEGQEGLKAFLAKRNPDWLT